MYRHDRNSSWSSWHSHKAGSRDGTWRLLLGVSDRTIRSDMNKLKKQTIQGHPDSSPQGLSASGPVLEDPNQPSHLGLPQTQEEGYIVTQALLADSQPQTSRLTGTSMSAQTLTMDLHQVRSVGGRLSDLRPPQHDARVGNTKARISETSPLSGAPDIRTPGRFLESG